MTDPDFWRPGMIDVHEDVANKKLTCDSSMAKVHCGNPDINRCACINFVNIYDVLAIYKLDCLMTNFSY